MDGFGMVLDWHGDGIGWLGVGWNGRPEIRAPLMWWLTPSRAIYMVKVCQRPCNLSASLNYEFRNVLFCFRVGRAEVALK